MITKHLHWAMTHDWYRGCKDGCVFVVDTSTNDNIIVKFESYILLREWAGY